MISFYYKVLMFYYKLFIIQGKNFNQRKNLKTRGKNSKLNLEALALPGGKL